MSKIFGTIKSVNIDGIDYDAMADSNPAIGGDVEIEGIATSGEPVFKVVVRINEAADIDLPLSMEQFEVIREIVRDAVPVSCSITYANGSVIRDSAMVKIASWTAQDGKCSIVFLPASAEGWETFAK